MVVFFHFRYYLNDIYAQKDLGDILFINGAFGVDLFFIISGFIICYATQKVEERPIIAYTLKRFFRIYPLMIMSLIIFYVMFGDGDFSFLKSVIPLHADYSKKGPFFGYNMLSPVWTLSYEITFYLLFLIGLSISQRYRKGITTDLILLIFVVLQLLLNQTVEVSAYSNYDYIDNVALKPIIAMLSSPMIIEFVYGITLYVLYTNLPTINDKHKHVANPVIIALVITSLLLFFSENLYGHGPFKWGLPSALLIFSLLFYERINGLPDVKWLYFLGNISFSLYLTHIIIIKTIRKYDISLGLDGFPAFLFAVTVSIAVATLVYQLVEVRSIAMCRAILNTIATRHRHTSTGGFIAPAR